MHRAVRPLIILSAVVLGAAACGDDGSTGTSPSSPSSTAPSVESGDATTSTTTTTTEALPSTTTTAAAPAGFVEFDPPTDTEFSVVQVTNELGHALDYRPDACIVAHNPDTGDSAGNIYGPNFGLNWMTEDEPFTLGWNYGDGVVQGEVDAEVDGDVVTFEGEIDGLAVRGTAYCYEGIG